MDNNIGWYHPTDESDQWDGFNDPGIETFAGTPIRSLAREVNQNALDAGEKKPVKVEIKLHQVDTSSIPNLHELKANLKACYEASKKESKKAETFLKTALAEIDKKTIKILEVSDYNTTGMRGPSRNGTAFYAFMKAKGQSRKDTDAATGSYGIGKFAPYSVSKLRTIFVSTIFQDDHGNYHQYTQGKSILMSHDVNGSRKEGVGFWGIKDKCRPFEGTSAEYPNWLQRVVDEEKMPEYKGSKLSILCFDDVKNWQEYLAVSVAENFFGAINKGELEVDIDSKYHLDQQTIKDFFENDKTRELISQLNDEPYKFDCCKSYLAALQAEKKENEIYEEGSEMSALGYCSIKILVGDGLPKKVCMLRNGMFISDNLNGLKRFSEFKEFSAVVECLSTRGNELLRDMEPPKHDDFEPNRLPTQAEQKKGKLALKNMAEWVRNMLKRHAKDPVSETTKIDELKDFFADDGADGSGKGEEEINPYGKVTIKGKPIKMKLQSAKRRGEGAIGGDGEGASGGGGSDGSGGGDGRGGTGSGKGGTGGGSQKPLVDVSNVRAIPIGSNTRKVAFTPTKTAKLAVSILEAGADTDYEVKAVRSSIGNIENGHIILDASAGKRISIEIEIDQDFSGALKVAAHEI